MSRAKRKVTKKAADAGDRWIINMQKTDMNEDVSDSRRERGQQTHRRSQTTLRQLVATLEGEGIDNAASSPHRSPCSRHVPSCFAVSCLFLSLSLSLYVQMQKTAIEAVREAFVETKVQKVRHCARTSSGSSHAATFAQRSISCTQQLD